MMPARAYKHTPDRAIELALRETSLRFNGHGFVRADLPANEGPFFKAVDVLRLVRLGRALIERRAGEPPELIVTRAPARTAFAVLAG